MLNVDLLKERYKTVVHCPEEWMAQDLLNEMRAVFGDTVYMDAVKWWTYYKNKTCYWIKIKNNYIGVEYCHREWFEGQGYRVLNYYDVFCAEHDYGEFETGQIGVLFGGL